MARKKKSMIGVDPLAWLTETNEIEKKDEHVANDKGLAIENNENVLDEVDEARLCLNTVQDISKVVALRNDIMSIVNENDAITINAELVERIDGTSMQVLCALFIYAKKHNLMITWLNPSKALIKTAEIVGVDSILELNKC